MLLIYNDLKLWHAIIFIRHVACLMEVINNKNTVLRKVLGTKMKKLTEMKNTRHLLTIGLLMAGSFASYAEAAPRPIRQITQLKSVMLDKISELSLDRYNIDEVELQVSYIVDVEGTVTVTEVTGANCFVNEYVRMMMEKDQVRVGETLVGQEVTMKIKYARV